MDGAFSAIDIKVAQRKVTHRLPPTQTQSRITLYTGNTYFAYPQPHWPGTFRPLGMPFADQASKSIATLSTSLRIQKSC